MEIAEAKLRELLRQVCAEYNVAFLDAPGEEGLKDALRGALAEVGSREGELSELNVMHTVRRNAAEFPQSSLAVLQIPLTRAPWATLHIPYPMRKDNWNELMAFLALMKRPLVRHEEGVP